MRILALNFQNRQNYKNNQYDYSRFYTKFHRQPQTDTFSSSVAGTNISFCAKHEQISREPLVRLYKEHLNCMCCGREMIDPKVIKTMEDNHIFDCSAKDAIKILEIYEHNMHKVEKDVFNLLKQEAEIEPDKNIKELIIELKKTHEKPLIQKQFGIFKLIDRYSAKIKPELHKEIRAFLLEASETIKEGNNKFSRIRFINRLEKILENYPNTANKEKLIRLAGKLPTAYDDVDAFIVKYAAPKYKSESIAIRLLSYSMVTIEHIHPQDSNDVKGANHLYNYVPECMRCNSFRSNKPMIYQLEDYPEMFINAQNLFDRLIDFANNSKLSKMYIIKLYKALYQESEGMLNLDYSRLNLTKELKKEIKKPFEYPKNPNKPDEFIPKPAPVPKPIFFDLKPKASFQITNKNYFIAEEISNTPMLTKRKRKRLIAEENNPKLKEKFSEVKTKKPKIEKKGTVRRNCNKR